MSNQDHECTYTSSYGDRPMCQIWYTNVKAHRSSRSDMKTWQKPINLTLRSKINIESGSWMYATHRPVVIHPCAKYDKPMLIQTKVMGSDTKTCQKPYKFDLDKVQDRIWIIMYATHLIMVIHSRAKYGKPMSIQKKGMGRTRKHVIDPIYLTLR